MVKRNKKRRKLRIERLIILILIFVSVTSLTVFTLTRVFSKTENTTSESFPIDHILEALSLNDPIEIDPSLMNSITSDYAAIMDNETGRFVADKNGTERMYPASLTKIMTAIVAIENEPDLDKTIYISYEMLNGLYEENASVAGFMEGDTPTVKDLLYGIALPSGADACNAVAYDIAGSIDDFVNLMNSKAKELGMHNTHFSNTTGLHEDDHYTTAEDLAILLRYCISNTTFATIFSTPYYTTTPISSHPYGITMQSTISKSETYYGIEIPGLIGGKTGFTYEAGKCLASWSVVDNHVIIIITGHAGEEMDGYDHFIDHGFLLSQIKTNLTQK